jgi:protein tyrosine phosphatase (PTP) superfamily phosphohydrolase (DUF442 family)
LKKTACLLILILGMVLVTTAAKAAPLSIELRSDSENSGKPTMGDHLRFWSTITNKGNTTVEGLVAWLSLVEVDPGHEQPVDLEDWSAHKAIAGAVLGPGQSLRTEWPMRLIKGGAYRVAVSVTERNSKTVITSPTIEFRVRTKPVLQSGRVVLVAVGIPLLILGLIGFKRIRRRAGRGLFHPSRMVKVLALVLVAATLAGGPRFWYLESQGNFHPITPGKAYRSAQLDRDELEYYIGKYGISSVINLRGRQNDDISYSDEIKVCRERHIAHYDLALSAGKSPRMSSINELLAMFEKAPRPVLIHCRAGADRAGLAAALWKMVVDGATKAEAKKQLSLWYGHLPLGPTQALDAFLEKYQMTDRAPLVDEAEGSSCLGP